MKKKILVFLGLLTLAITLSGCSNLDDWQLSMK